jgi:fucose permease
VTFSGWFFAALTNSHLTQVLYLGAILTLGASLQLLAHVLRSWRPPFALFAATFFFAHLGQAYQDAHANTYVSSVKSAHRWLGFIHAMYAAGCLVGPFVATAIASANDPSKWNLFYTFPLGMCTINVAITAYAFRHSLTMKRKASSDEEISREALQSRNKGALKEMSETVRLPAVWLLSLFFFFFLGVAITAGGKAAIDDSELVV